MKKVVDFFLKKSSKLAYFGFLQVQISTEVGHFIYGLKGLTETKSENLKSNFNIYFFQLIGLNMLCNFSLELTICIYMLVSIFYFSIFSIFYSSILCGSQTLLAYSNLDFIS